MSYFSDRVDLSHPAVAIPRYFPLLELQEWLAQLGLFRPDLSDSLRHCWIRLTLKCLVKRGYAD